MTFTVITKVPPLESGGNLATPLGMCRETAAPHEDNDYLGRYEVLSLMGVLPYRMPVFLLGEILVTIDGREIGGAGRNPGKWMVDFEMFADADEAIARSREVMDNSDILGLSGDF